MASLQILWSLLALVFIISMVECGCRNMISRQSRNALARLAETRTNQEAEFKLSFDGEGYYNEYCRPNDSTCGRVTPRTSSCEHETSETCFRIKKADDPDPQGPGEPCCYTDFWWWEPFLTGGLVALDNPIFLVGECAPNVLGQQCCPHVNPDIFGDDLLICKQKYKQVRVTVVIVPDGTPFDKYFIIPSYCFCHFLPLQVGGG